MEREYSAQSLLRGGSSEMGSRHITETGIFMSSFAAMVFVSGLITVGVSLLSLLVALAVMLHSCESRNSGILEMHRYKDNYDYCRYFALHAELNSLDADSLPAICGDVERLYVKEGQYGRDLNITVGIAEEFFGSVRPQVDSRDIVLIDADDLASETLFSYYLMHRINEDPLHGSSGDPDYLRHTFARKLYLKLQSDGWPLVLFSRKPEKLRSAMAEYLISMGCPGWSSLIMRKENEMQMSFQEYISGQRIILQREGLRIVAVISSRMDALRGPYLGNRMFKFPSPMFRHSMENHVESHVQKSK